MGRPPLCFPLCVASSLSFAEQVPVLGERPALPTRPGSLCTHTSPTQDSEENKYPPQKEHLTKSKLSISNQIPAAPPGGCQYCAVF